MYQTHLTTHIIKKIYLTAPKSPRRAWWYLEINELAGEFSLLKISGAGDNVLDRRKWPMKSLEHAEKEFDRRVKSKLDPKRKRRCYKKTKPPLSGFAGRKSH